MKQKEVQVAEAAPEQKPERKVKVKFGDRHIEIAASEMVKLGYEQRRSARFQSGQMVLWDGRKYVVGGILLPHQFDYHLRYGCREFGYELQPARKGYAPALIAEPELRLDPTQGSGDKG